MAEITDQIVFDLEDLQAIIQLFKDNEEFEKSVETVIEDIDQTASNSFKFECEHCGKKTKSKGGLTRHLKSKHDQLSAFDHHFNSSVTPDELDGLIIVSASFIVNDKCYDENFKESLVGYCHPPTSPDDELYKDIKSVYDKLSGNGKLDEFYKEFYGSLVFESAKYFPNLNEQLSTLLMTVLCDKLICHYKSPPDSYASSSSQPKSIQNVELDALKYLAGYVIHKLIKKARNSKSFKSVVTQGHLNVLESILSTGDDGESNQNNSLIECQNRGGLKVVNNDCFQIFKECELVFRMDTDGKSLSKIDIPFLVEILIKNGNVSEYFGNIVSNLGELSIDPEEVLVNMLTLYLRVRAFSFCRDQVQKYKKALKLKKAKGSLRKDIQSRSKDGAA